jgi:hypothetical protein
MSAARFWALAARAALPVRWATRLMTVMRPVSTRIVAVRMARA